MKASELAPHPDLSIAPLPVVCERCKAQGIAGDDAFSAVADILAFDPVPRRARADGWRPEHQRAFIAALALTGSPRQAARAVGKHQFGAEGLRKARGGRGFADAWDAAMELARERELLRIREQLGDLAAADQEAAAAQAAADPSGAPGPWVRRLYGDAYDPDEYLEGHAAMIETMGAIRDRLLNARRLYLMSISGRAEARAAWETLVGPTDWDKAAAMQPQPDEPPQHPGAPGPVLPRMTAPDMVLVAHSGLLPDIAGGRDLIGDLLAEHRAGEAEAEAGAQALEPPATPPAATPSPAPPLSPLPPFPAWAPAPPLLPEELPTEQDLADEEALWAELKAAGWREDAYGNLWSPDPEEE